MTLRIANIEPAKVVVEGRDTKHEILMRPDVNPYSNLIAKVEPGPEPGTDESYSPDNSDSKKNKVRGFFRKVSRVFDKATSIEPNQNSKGGIRVASFAVALK